MGYESKRKTSNIMVSGLSVLAVLSGLRYARGGEGRNIGAPFASPLPGLSAFLKMQCRSLLVVVVVLHRLIYCSSPFPPSDSLAA